MIQEIEEYGVLIADSPSALSERVNQRIKEGWVPLGGIAIAVSPQEINTDGSGGDYWEYAQAMVRVKG